MTIHTVPTDVGGLIMTAIKKYTLKNGETRYMFNAYLGSQANGKQRRTTRRGFKTKKEAQLASSRLLVDIDKGKKVVNVDKAVFSNMYEDWLTSYVNTVRTSTYVKSVRIFESHILPYFGNMYVKDIRPRDIQRAVNQWYEIAECNYKKWFYYLQSVLNYAVKNEFLDKNPCKMVNLPKRKQKSGDKEENFWTREELEKFFSCIDKESEPEQFMLFRLLAFTGIRRGECLALTWNDVNFDKGTLRINKTLTQGEHGTLIIQPPKTAKSKRTVIIDQQTLHYLQVWRLKQKKQFLMYGFNTFKKDQLIFASSKNSYKSLDQPWKWLSKIIRVNKLKKITVHGFRHSHASALFSAGASIKEVQERLGHEDVQTTMNIYTHVTAKQNKNAVDKLSSYLNF